MSANNETKEQIDEKAMCMRCEKDVWFMQREDGDVNSLLLCATCVINEMFSGKCQICNNDSNDLRQCHGFDWFTDVRCVLRICPDCRININEFDGNNGIPYYICNVCGQSELDWLSTK